MIAHPYYDSHGHKLLTSNFSPLLVAVYRSSKTPLYFLNSIYPLRSQSEPFSHKFRTQLMFADVDFVLSSMPYQSWPNHLFKAFEAQILLLEKAIHSHVNLEVSNIWDQGSRSRDQASDIRPHDHKVQPHFPDLYELWQSL